MQNDDDFMPFKIERAYWIYDVPVGAERGSHAHIEALSLIIAAGGSFNVNLFDGVKWWKFTLNRPFEALFVPPGYWRTLDNFSSGSVCACRLRRCHIAKMIISAISTHLCVPRLQYEVSFS